jgi:16S rRNA (uracil1498-N3)-methyltransferase
MQYAAGVKTPRFFVPEALAGRRTLALPSAVNHHAVRVLRLRPGEEVVLFDGSGSEFEARIAPGSAKDSPWEATILSSRAQDREARLHVTLVQTLSATEKIDWLLEKAVELGLARLILVPALRSVVHLDGARGAQRLARWQEMAVSACAQCGRNRVPQIELAGTFEAGLRAAAAAPARYILDPQGAPGFGAMAPGPVSIAVGPEGGFAPQERALAVELGYAPVRIGPRVMRTETAGLVGLCILLAKSGEYDPPHTAE